MSIVTLKKKTQAKYNNSSVGFKNFSINGTTRNQGYVGQDSRSRSLIKTPMVGNVPRGSSACCGKYPVKIVCPSGINYQENNSQIKPSVLSNYGSIATHYRWVGRPQPFTTVKPDTNLSLNNSSGAYTINLQRAVLNSINVYDASNNAIIQQTLGTSDANPRVVNNPYIYKYKNYQRRALCPAITKVLGPLDQSTYILNNVESGCINSTVTNVAYGVQKQPYAGFSESY
jgi:hypothetical protein